MANHSTSNLQGLNHDSLRKRRCHKEDSIEAAENLSFRISATDMVAERNNNKPVSWKKKSSQLLYENLCLHAGNASSVRGLTCTNQALRLWFSRFHAVLICTNQALRLWFLRLELLSGWCWSQSNQWMLEILRFLFISFQFNKAWFLSVSFQSYSGTISHFLEQCLRTSCLNQCRAHNTLETPCSYHLYRDQIPAGALWALRSNGALSSIWEHTILAPFT